MNNIRKAVILAAGIGYRISNKIEDVPNDQGSWAYINFIRSGYDRSDEYNTPVTNYFIFRRVDNTAMQQLVLERGELLTDDDIMAFEVVDDKRSIPRPVNNADLLRLDGDCYLVSQAQTSSEVPPGIWAVVGSAPAHQEDQYIALVPTVADSTSDLVYSVYIVSAEIIIVLTN